MCAETSYHTSEICKFLLQHRELSTVLQWVVGVLVIFGGIGLIIGLLSPTFYLRNKTTSQATSNRPTNPTTTSTRPTGTGSSKHSKPEQI